MLVMIECIECSDVNGNWQRISVVIYPQVVMYEKLGITVSLSL